MRVAVGSVCVVAATTVTSFGVAGRGLGRMFLEGRLPPPGAAKAPLPTRPEEARQKKLMSRSAWLCAVAMREALSQASWVDGREEIGAFYGVGASGAEMDEVGRLIESSLVDGRFSLARCGAEGLNAVSPLFAFQIMNNFTLCHGAILEGLGGPNAAFFSRGVGTVTALEEACFAITSAQCERALVGGADTAMHPVTLAELEREGFLRAGLLPTEGAATLALTGTSTDPIGHVLYVSVEPAARHKTSLFPRTSVLRDVALIAAVDALEEQSCDVLVLAPWGLPAREALADLSQALDAELHVDASLLFGEALAASPALAWALALDLMAETNAKRALVISVGPDGDVGVVLFGRGGAL